MNTNLPLIVRAAVEAEKVTGCPAELQTAQCILETGYLKHSPGNNCFGIKVYKGCYGRQLLHTTEWFTDLELQAFLALGDQRTAIIVHPIETDRRGAKKYAVQDWFATFPSLRACFVKRSSLWNAGRYAPSAKKYLLTRNISDLVLGIAPIYATDPIYASKVLDIIKQQSVQDALHEARTS